MLFSGSSHVVADGHNRLSTQNWWCASRRLATCQQLVDPHLLGIHICELRFSSARAKGRPRLVSGLKRRGSGSDVAPGRGRTLHMRVYLVSALPSFFQVERLASVKLSVTCLSAFRANLFLGIF
jgi:hypothetical protein